MQLIYPKTAKYHAYGRNVVDLNVVVSRKVVIVLVATNIIMVAALAYVVAQNSQLAQNGDTKFGLLSANVAWLDLEEFLEKQKTMTVSYTDMKQAVLDYYGNHNLNGRYSVYFEDLTTGAWMGIDERTGFVPASLLKMPTMIAIMKNIETGDLSLDDTVVLTEGMIDRESGTLWKNGPGYSITVRELMKYLIRESDNTALWALDSLITMEEYAEARDAIGLPVPKSLDDAMVSPKAYSNILRALYFSTYLRRTFSQLTLSIMSETDYNSMLPSGVPTSVKVAHKIGFYPDGGSYHDCGIVYAPGKPYILCVMSRDSTMAEANSATSGISSIVYNYVDKQAA